MKARDGKLRRWRPLGTLQHHSLSGVCQTGLSGPVSLECVLSAAYVPMFDQYRTNTKQAVHGWAPFRPPWSVGAPVFVIGLATIAICDREGHGLLTPAVSAGRLLTPLVLSAHPRRNLPKSMIEIADRSSDAWTMRYSCGEGVLGRVRNTRDLLQFS